MGGDLTYVHIHLRDQTELNWDTGNLLVHSHVERMEEKKTFHQHPLRKCSLSIEHIFLMLILVGDYALAGSISEDVKI